MKILILTASAGNGHNSAAQRLKEKFLKEEPSSVIEIADIYKSYASRTQQWIIEQGYFFACNHLLSLYNYFYKKSEHTDFSRKEGFPCHKQTYSMFHGLLSKIYDFKPDLIISTYFLASIALENIKRVYPIPAKVACMTLDYNISPYWECCSNAIDYMFLTGEYMVDKFVDRGFKRENLFVAGIPISYEFYEDKDKQKCREMLGLDKDLFTLIIMKASFFPLREKHIVKQLSQVQEKIQVVIINGRDEKSKNKIDKYLKKYNLNHVVHNIGFTRQVPDYFAGADLVLGKGGGLTVTESVAIKLPALILNKLPQQEIYNREYIAGRGCAIEIKNNIFYPSLNDLIKNKNKYNKMVENTQKLRAINVLDKYYEILKNIPKADYKNIKLLDNKKELIKKINNSRKKSLKLAKNK